jgi:hypothetical protein
MSSVAQSYPSAHMVLSHSVLETSESNLALLMSIFFRPSKDLADSHPAANQVVPNALPQLRNAGYQLVSVDTCLGGNGEPSPYYGLYSACCLCPVICSRSPGYDTMNND